MARRRVRSTMPWRQPLLPGLAEQLPPVAPAAADGGAALAAGQAGAAGGEAPTPVARGGALEWEEACFQAACRYACQLALSELAALESRLHAQRPAGYAVEGWRERTLVTRFGDVRVRRRLYHAPDGTAHFLLDEHLGWPPAQVATPAFAALVVAWATDRPFRTAADHLAHTTAGVVSGSTAWRLLQHVAARVVAHEATTHATWAKTAALPAPLGERVVPVLYVEADGVWVKTQREPAHRHGYELKCASMYEGWERVGEPTPGHPRPHYRLVHKQVYCHGQARADARAPVPFWEAVSLALSPTYDLSQVPLVVVGGDGATWIDTAHEVFPQAVRHRDGFHLARDAARGWGPAAGAGLYQAVRAGDHATTVALLALPALPAPQRAVALLPPPAPPPPPPTPPAEATLTELTEPPATATATMVTGIPPAGETPVPLPAAVSATRPTTTTTNARQSGTAGTGWSAAQVQRARATFTSQVTTTEAAIDWRRQVAPDLVPPDARALGTQEGTNAHLLAKRMKHKGMAWRATGARAMAKARELVTNGTLAPWCHRHGPTSTAAASPPRAPGGFASAGPLLWPQVTCATARGPLSDPTAATLHHIDTSGRTRHRLT